MRFSRADRLTDVVHFKSWLLLPPLRHGCRGSSALWREKFDLFFIRQHRRVNMARNYGFEDFPGEDQTVEGDYIDELIRKYLYSEDMNR